MTPNHPHPDCAACNDYLARRGDVLVPHVVATARSRGVRASGLLVRYVRAVHRRHVSGLTLAVTR